MPGFKISPRDQGSPRNESGSHGSVELLLERFPHVRGVSLQLLVRNEAFRDLCDEYATCTEAAERFEQSAVDDALCKEYKALQLRLEGELLGYLLRDGGGDGPR